MSHDRAREWYSKLARDKQLKGYGGTACDLADVLDRRAAHVLRELAERANFAETPLYYALLSEAEKLERSE